MIDTVSSVEADWASLGAGLTGTVSAETPDLERLLISTAACSSSSPRLFTVALTWLSRYGSLVAEHRLFSLVCDGALGDDHLPVLGLILDHAILHARAHDRTRNLERTLAICTPAQEPRPLFDIDSISEMAQLRAERRASVLSRKWCLWVDEISPKYDALRPAWWIVRQNPSLRLRADFRGDLRCTILLVLQEEPEAASSISELARRCHASRPAVVRALQDLEWGYVRRHHAGAARELSLIAA